MKHIYFFFKSKFLNKYSLFIALFIFGTNMYSQKLYILKFSMGTCVNECAALQSFYFLSNNYGVEPIAGTDSYLIFDKPPTFVELISVADTGFNCAWRDPMACYMRTNININDCFWGMSNEVLTIPIPGEISSSFCDKISLKAVSCPGTQRYSWEYSTDGINYNKTNVTTGVNQNYEFVKSNFPLLNNYFGNIFFRVLIDSDPNFTEENIYSNTVIYSITSCSPLLENGYPITEDVKCNNTSTGSATLKFATDITKDQKLLLNLYEGTAFRGSTFAKFSDIVNRTFTWDGIATGSYTIKYQAQSINDPNDEVGSTPVISPSFVIKNPLPLTFTATAVQPLCSTDKGGIQITVFGGTPPYSYILDDQSKKELLNNPYTVPVTIDGIHKVIVTDKYQCIEKSN